MADDRPVLTEVEVTPAMIEAGLTEMGEHRFCGDLAYMVESVFRAMHYARRAASATSDSM